MTPTRERDRALETVLDTILADYGSTVPIGDIVRCFADCVHDLRDAGVRAGLSIAANTMTRRRLGRAHEGRRVVA